MSSEALALVWERPWAWALLVLPALVLLAARRRDRPTALHTGAFELWLAIAGTDASRAAHERRRVPPPVWLFAAGLAAAVAAIAGPRPDPRAPSPLRVVVDRTPSMYLDDGGVSRLERALALLDANAGPAMREWVDAGADPPERALASTVPPNWLAPPRVPRRAPDWSAFDAAGTVWLTDAPIQSGIRAPANASLCASGGRAVPGLVAVRGATAWAWDGDALHESDAGALRARVRVDTELPAELARFVRAWASARGVVVEPGVEAGPVELEVRATRGRDGARDELVAVRFGRDGWSASGIARGRAPPSGRASDGSGDVDGGLETWLAASDGANERALVTAGPGRVHVALAAGEDGLFDLAGSAEAFAVSWGELLDRCLLAPPGVVVLAERADAGPSRWIQGAPETPATADELAAARARLLATGAALLAVLGALAWMRGARRSASLANVLWALALFTTSSFAGAAGSAGVAPSVGERVGEFRFTDTRWLPRTLADFGERPAYVIAFTSLDCPVARRTMPRLGDLERALRPRGVQFLAIDVGPGDELVEVAARAVEQRIDFPVARDFDGSAVTVLGAERTPEILVLDRERRVAYRGRFDAKERLTGTASGDVRADLAEAVDDVLAGRAVRVAWTPVDGCKITPPSRDAALQHAIDWEDGVRDIVANRCAGCHAAGKSAPFALEHLGDARSKAAMIAEVVEEGRMPPWFATRASGPFSNERRLGAVERAALLAWARAGGPGAEEAPAQPRESGATPATDADVWRIGTPDLVLRVPTLSKLPATGVLPYRYVILPHVFAADTWVEAVEIRPSNRRVVHHANLAYYQLGGEFKTDNFITGEVPGGDAMDLGPGTALMIPAGSVLGLQIHYVTTGREEEDRISVGLRFPRVAVEKRLRHHAIASTRLAIPPFAPAHEVVASRQLDVDAEGIGMFVHMHLRGRDMRFEALEPGSDAPEELLLVPNYQFDWQLAYPWPRGAKSFPKGTTIRCTAHFDNSAFNPFNPDPSKTVTFGEETVDEMMYGFFFYVARDEALGLAVDPKTGALSARGGAR